MADNTADLEMRLHAVGSREGSRWAQPEDVNTALYAGQARTPWIRELHTHPLTYFSYFFSGVEALDFICSPKHLKWANPLIGALIAASCAGP
jgi:hypothetical protein